MRLRAPLPRRVLVRDVGRLQAHLDLEGVADSPTVNVVGPRGVGFSDRVGGGFPPGPTIVQLPIAQILQISRKGSPYRVFFVPNTEGMHWIRPSPCPTSLHRSDGDVEGTGILPPRVQNPVRDLPASVATPAR
jgi:hypothetical protein